MTGGGWCLFSTHLTGHAECRQGAATSRAYGAVQERHRLRAGLPRHDSSRQQRRRDFPLSLSLPHRPGAPPAPQRQGYPTDGGQRSRGQLRYPDRCAAQSCIARPQITPQQTPQATPSSRRAAANSQHRGGPRVTRQGRCPRGGVAAVRALRSHWLPTRKRSERLRAAYRAEPLAAAAPCRGDGGGRAAVPAARGAKRGEWRAAAGPVGAVLLAGPVALRPLRRGALRIYLPAALMGRAQVSRGEAGAGRVPSWRQRGGNRVPCWPARRETNVSQSSPSPPAWAPSRTGYCCHAGQSAATRRFRVNEPWSRGRDSRTKSGKCRCNSEQLAAWLLSTKALHCVGRAVHRMQLSC